MLAFAQLVVLRNVDKEEPTAFELFIRHPYILIRNYHFILIFSSDIWLAKFERLIWNQSHFRIGSIGPIWKSYTTNTHDNIFFLWFSSFVWYIYAGFRIEKCAIDLESAYFWKRVSIDVIQFNSTQWCEGLSKLRVMLHACYLLPSGWCCQQLMTFIRIDTFIVSYACNLFITMDRYFHCSFHAFFFLSAFSISTDIVHCIQWSSLLFCFVLERKFSNTKYSRFYTNKQHNIS